MYWVVIDRYRPAKVANFEFNTYRPVMSAALALPVTLVIPATPAIGFTKVHFLTCMSDDRRDKS